VEVQDLHAGFCEGIDRYLAPNRMPFLESFDGRPLINPGEPYGPDEA
jgi:hypothetical protein